MARVRFMVEGSDSLHVVVGPDGASASLSLKEAEEAHAALGGHIADMRSRARRAEAQHAGVTFQKDGTEEGQR